MFASYFSITGDEHFYRSFIMPAVMRTLNAERSHTFAVWLASKGLVPVDIDGDPEILVNILSRTSTCGRHPPTMATHFCPS